MNTLCYFYILSFSKPCIHTGYEGRTIIKQSGRKPQLCLCTVQTQLALHFFPGAFGCWFPTGLARTIPAFCTRKGNHFQLCWRRIPNTSSKMEPASRVISWSACLTQKQTVSVHYRLKRVKEPAGPVDGAVAPRFEISRDCVWLQLWRKDLRWIATSRPIRWFIVAPRESGTADCIYLFFITRSRTRSSSVKPGILTHSKADPSISTFMRMSNVRLTWTVSASFS